MWKYDCYRFLNYMHFLVYKAINAEELGTFDLAFWVGRWSGVNYGDVFQAVLRCGCKLQRSEGRQNERSTKIAEVEKI